MSLGSRTVISQQTVWYWNALEGTVSATTSHTSLGSLIILPEFYHSKPMNLWLGFLYQKQTLQLLYLDQEIRSSTTQPARIIPEKDLNHIRCCSQKIAQWIPVSFVSRIFKICTRNIACKLRAQNYGTPKWTKLLNVSSLSPKFGLTT